MAALSNQEATQRSQALALVERTLQSIVRKTEANIQETKHLACEIKRQLTTHVDPILKADVIGTPSIVKK